MKKNLLVLFVLAGGLYVAADYLVTPTADPAVEVMDDTTTEDNMTTDSEGASTPVDEETTAPVPSAAASTVTNESTPATQPAASPGDTAFTIDTSSLSSAQRSVLSTLGIDESVITVTNEMFTCAAGKLGSARLEEIKNGSLPSLGESFSLFSCY